MGGREKWCCDEVISWELVQRTPRFNTLSSSPHSQTVKQEINQLKLARNYQADYSYIN